MDSENLFEVRETLLFRESLLRMVVAAGHPDPSLGLRSPLSQQTEPAADTRSTPAVEQFQSWARELSQQK